MLRLVVRGRRFPGMAFVIRMNRGGSIAETAPPAFCGWRTFSRFNKTLVLSGACDLSTPELRHAFGEARVLLPALETRNKRIFPCMKSVCCFSTSTSGNADDGKLVYTGKLAKAVLGVKFFSYSTSMVNFCMLSYIVFKSGIGIGIGTDSLALQIAFFSIIGFFTFLTPVILHLATKGYVVRLYHKAETDTYTAITYSILLTQKRTVFHQKDVKIPGVSKMFTTFYARTKSMFVNPAMFSNPVDYNHLMGYDKPFTFDLENL